MQPAYQHVYSFIINLIPAAVLGNNKKCFSTEDPDVHRARKVHCQVEPGTLKKVICRAKSRPRYQPRSLTSTHFSPQESSLIIFFISQRHPFFVSKKKQNRASSYVTQWSRGNEPRKEKNQETKQIEIKHLPTTWTTEIILHYAPETIILELQCIPKGR